MSKKFKYFVISDIHGYYDEAKKALDDAGFDVNNENHKLLVLGDIFDRGSKSKEVYFWLKDLTFKNKAIVLKGNHDSFLIKFLTKYNLLDNQFNFYNNGLKSTISSFLDNKYSIDDYYNRKNELNEKVISKFKAFNAWNIIVSQYINETYPDLLYWISSFPYYYETEHYIFTHASIDTSCKDYRFPNKDWDDLLWDDGSFFGERLKKIKKTVVVGHFSVADIRKMYGISKSDDFSVLPRYDKKVIMIDGCVMVSGRINVLIIED